MSPCNARRRRSKLEIAVEASSRIFVDNRHHSHSSSRRHSREGNGRKEKSIPKFPSNARHIRGLYRDYRQYCEKIMINLIKLQSLSAPTIFFVVLTKNSNRNINLLYLALNAKYNK